MSAFTPAFTAQGGLVQPAAAGEAPLPDGTALAEELRAGRTTSRAIVSAYLDRIETLNPAFNAVVSLRERDAVLAEADAADEARAGGGALGPLHGLPIAIKDLAATAGLTTTQGSPLYAETVPTADDLAVARIRTAGAIFLGKTNVPEFGLGSHTINPVFGPTRNAYLPDRSAGGSSGGAAVALALGLLPIADGSDFGGSLRNPAGWNNVFGFRPSQGRVPTVPSADPWYGQLSTLGPMGRSVRDVAALLSVMAGEDVRAPLSLPDPAAPFESGLAPSAALPRIAWLGDLGGRLPFEDGVLDLCEGALAALETAGWTVERPPADAFDWAALWESFVVLRQLGLATRYGEIFGSPESRASLKPAMVWELEHGEALTGGEIAQAMRVRGAWYAAARGMLARVDALVLPSAQLFPFPVEWDWPKSIAGREMDSYHRWMEVVAPGTLCGSPVGNVPAGFSAEGLPMGLQLIGQPKDDAGVLALMARYVEDAPRRVS